MHKKALLVSHQLDYSGAPVALLQLATALTQDGWSIDLYSSLGIGPIANEFKSIGISIKASQPLEIQFQAYDFVLFNTVVATPLIPNLKPNNAKWILWVHESPYLGGFAWSSAVNMKNLHNIDSLVFPSESCKMEWENFINVNHSNIIPSPVNIPKNIAKISQNHQNNTKTFCIIDPRESYRNIEKIETEILNHQEEAIFNFVGTTPPEKVILKKLCSKKNITVNYFGRIKHERALEILAESDIYMSATSMATQNRGLCEALTMNKKIYISKIKVHEEIGKAFNLTEDAYFYPLERINLNINLPSTNYLNKMFNFDIFKQKWDLIL